MDMSVDTTTPAQVNDLRVTNLTGLVRLQFTAPGNDLDSDDKADKYIIKYSSTAANLTGNNFDDDVFNTEIKAEDLVDCTLSPEDGGTTKTIDIKTSIFTNDKKYVVAMKALDFAGNVSPISNRVQIFITSFQHLITTTTTSATATTPSDSPSTVGTTVPTPSPSGCSDSLLFSTDSYPSGKLVCYDDRAGEKTMEDTMISPGTTCIFLSSGHVDHGFVAELFCQENHWVVTITE